MSKTSPSSGPIGVNLFVYCADVIWREKKEIRMNRIVLKCILNPLSF